MQNYIVLTTLIFFVYGANGGIVKHEEENAPAYYKFSYGVNDPHTGDKKEHYETRDGHVVKGAYTMQEADGTVRVVEYTAEPHKGFKAVVKRLGVATHPQVYKSYGGHKGESVGSGHAGGGGSAAGKPSFGKGYGVKEPEEYNEHEDGAISSINNNLGYSGGKDNVYGPKKDGYTGGKSASYTVPEERHFSEIKEGGFGEPSEYETEFEEELAAGYTNKQNTYDGPSSKTIIQNKRIVVPNYVKEISAPGVPKSYVSVTHYGSSTLTPRH